MIRVAVIAVIASICAPVAPTQTQSLTTLFASNNNQAGNMFDVLASARVTIKTFDLNLEPGTWDVEVYTRVGTHVGFEGSSASWTLVGSVSGVVSAGPNQPTPLPLDLDVPMFPGFRRAFYVTASNGNGTRYTTTSSPVGSVLASDSSLTVYVGTGKSYPFGATFAPRSWNGTIHYEPYPYGFLATPFDSNNSQAGNMFDVTATSTLIVRGADLNLGLGTWDVEIYSRPGTHVGAANSPLGWNLVAATPGIVSAGQDVPTTIPFSLNVVIPAGGTRAFYTTCTNGVGTRYTTVSSPVGSVAASNSDLSILVGIGKTYPFGGTFPPRRWNGALTYEICPNGGSEYQLNSYKASLNHNGITTNGCEPAVTVVRSGQILTANVTTSLIGLPHDAIIYFGPQVPRGSAGALELSDGQVFNVPIAAPGAYFFYGGAVPAPLPAFNFALPFSAPPGPIEWCAQVVYLDFTSPSVITLSAASTVRVLDIDVMVEAVGPNSASNDPSSGFWRITNLGQGTVTQVNLDFASAQDPQVALGYFDTDQGGLADRFDGGNSQTPGCLGTYRLGSDVLTGLNYASSPVSPCDPAARTGWTGSNPVFVGAFRTLDFAFAAGQFTNGETFQFDCDTDGGVFSGGTMAGLPVTVVVNGVTVNGILQADPVDPNRSFVLLSN